MYTFEYQRPTTRAAAAAAIQGDARFLAGGQSLVQAMRLRLASAERLVDLGGIADLKGITVDASGVRIGAMTTHAAVAASAEVRKAIPALAELAESIGDPMVRNMGTLGGSIANADPAADYPAGLVGLAATVHTDKRDIAADPIYQSQLVTKFINCIMSGGKRSTAERILYKSFDIIKDKTGDDPLKVFKKAVENVKPALEVKSRRVGGSNYQVPVEVNPNRRLSLSIRWIVGYATSRGDGKTMQEKLANELLDAANLSGGAVKKREDVHRMAEANKAFAHYRW